MQASTAFQLDRRAFLGMGGAAALGAHLPTPGRTVLVFSNRGNDFRLDSPFQKDLHGFKARLESYGLRVSTEQYEDEWEETDPGVLCGHLVVHSNSIPVAFAGVVRAWAEASPEFRSIWIMREDLYLHADTPEKIEALFRLL